LLASLLLLFTASTAYAAHGRRKMPSICHLPPHARMLVADSQAQVYERLETEAQDGGIYGCAFGSKHTYFLGERPGFSSSGGGGIEFETLAGSSVAYEESVVGPGGKYEAIIVRGLRDGRVLHKIPTGPSVSSKNVGSGPTTAIVVKGNGAVAWVAENDALSSKEAKYYEVHAVDSMGSRVLASGSGIEPLSLALTGSTLYWAQSGNPASALLN
jgi:hypothetical protein